MDFQAVIAELKVLRRSMDDRADWNEEWERKEHDLSQYSRGFHAGRAAVYRIASINLTSIIRLAETESPFAGEVIRK